MYDNGEQYLKRRASPALSAAVAVSHGATLGAAVEKPLDPKKERTVRDDGNPSGSCNKTNAYSPWGGAR
jgi:hypothetical protein